MTTPDETRPEMFTWWEKGLVGTLLLFTVFASGMALLVAP